MITGHAVSHLEGNARIWILTVNEIPTPGALVEWDEPAVGSIPAQSGVRGWISGEESTRPGTQILTVVGHGSRWVKIIVKAEGSAIGVSNVDRTPTGTRYLITRNSDSRIAVGSVTIAEETETVRNSLNQPVSQDVETQMRAAVFEYLTWAERH